MRSDLRVAVPFCLALPSEHSSAHSQSALEGRTCLCVCVHVLVSLFVCWFFVCLLFVCCCIFVCLRVCSLFWLTRRSFVCLFVFSFGCLMVNLPVCWSVVCLFVFVVCLLFCLVACLLIHLFSARLLACWFHPEVLGMPPNPMN